MFAVPVIDTENYNDEAISLVLAKAVMYSFERLTYPGDDERAQKVAVLDVLRPMLKLCGYNCESKSHLDFQFIHKQASSTDKENFIMCGVAKEVKNLPQKSTQDELELGLGFIAHLNDIQKEMIESAKKVRRSNFKQAKLESKKDAFNLWGATM